MFGWLCAFCNLVFESESSTIGSLHSEFGDVEINGPSQFNGSSSVFLACFGETGGFDLGGAGGFGSAALPGITSGGAGLLMLVELGRTGLLFM
jgi:hypothetical protein